MVRAVKIWAAARWRTLRKGGGIVGVALLLAMATFNVITRDFYTAFWLAALAVYFAEWQHWRQRCEEDEIYADLGRQIMIQHRAARQRGHNNLLITFDETSKD